MNRRVVLAFAAAAVAALGIILYLAVTSSDSSEAASTAAPPRNDVGRPGPGSSGDVPSVPNRGSASTQPGAGTTAATGSSVREYIVDGARVRDHRTGDKPPLTSIERTKREPTEARNGGRVLGQVVTSALGSKVREVVAECAKLVPKPPSKEKSALRGKIFLDIKGRQARVSGTDLSMTGAHAPETVAAVTRCMNEKAVGLVTSADGEADAERFEIDVTFGIVR